MNWDAEKGILGIENSKPVSIFRDLGKYLVRIGHKGMCRDHSLVYCPKGSSHPTLPIWLNNGQNRSIAWRLAGRQEAMPWEFIHEGLQTLLVLPTS